MKLLWLVLFLAISPLALADAVKGSEYKAKWLDRIKSSPNPDELLVAVMMAQHAKPALVPQLLKQSFDTGQNPTLINQLAVYYCQSMPISEFCADKSFAVKLSQSDSDNIEPFLYLFVQNYEQENWKEAFLSLQQGLSKKEDNSYYLQKLHLTRQILKRSNFPIEKLNSTSESIALSIYPYYYSKLLKLCPQAAKTSAEWKSLCLALGRRLEKRKDSIMATMVGFGIQRDIFKGNRINNDMDLFEAVMKRRAAYMSIRDIFYSDYNHLLNADNRSEQFYTLMMKYGEYAVLKHYIESK